MTALDAVNDLVAGKQVKIPVQYIPMIEYGLNNRPGVYEIDVEIRGKWATLTPKGQDNMGKYQWKESEHKLLMEHLQHSVYLLRDTGEADDRALANVLEAALRMYECGGIQAMSIGIQHGERNLYEAVVGKIADKEDELVERGMEIVRKIMNEKDANRE